MHMTCTIPWRTRSHLVKARRRRSWYWVSQRLRPAHQNHQQCHPRQQRPINSFYLLRLSFQETAFCWVQHHELTLSVDRFTVIDQSVIKLLNSKCLGTIISVFDSQSLSNLDQHQTNASERQLKDVQWTAPPLWTVQLAPFLSTCRWTGSLCQCFFSSCMPVDPTTKHSHTIMFFAAMRLMMFLIQSSVIGAVACLGSVTAVVRNSAPLPCWGWSAT